MTLETVLVEVIRRSDYPSEEAYQEANLRLQRDGWRMARDAIIWRRGTSYSYTILYKEIWSGEHE